METFFQKYLWLVLLAMLGTSALLMASGVNKTIAATWLLPPPKPLLIEVPAEEGQARQARGQAIVARSLFDASRLEQIPEEGSGEGGDPEDQPPVDVPEGELGEHVPLSDLSVEVTGTVVSTITSSSNASIKDGAEAGLYFNGDEVKDGAVVYAIRRNAVYVTRNGRLERLVLGEKPKPGGPGGGARKPGAQTSFTRTGQPAPGGDAKPKDAMASIREGVRKVGTGEYEVDRSMLDDQLQDLNKLGSQARIIPHYKDGRADGFKLVGIRPGSLYTYLGVRSGDVIRRVNGDEINSPSKALTLYEQLRSAARVTVDIERRGKPMSLNFNIK